MKSTSIKSYYELVESGELSKKQIEVANCFRKMGPMTGRQVSAQIPGAWKRIKELADMGILEPVNTVLDLNTRKVVTVWGWTGDQPLLVPLKEDRAAKKSALYDKAYEQGVRDTLSYLYQGHISEAFVYEIVERRK